MSRHRIFALALAASVLAALPGVQPFALSSAPLMAGHGDVWHAHREPAAPLAIAVPRADRVSARPSRIVLGDHHAAAAMVFGLTIVGAIDAVDHPVPAIDCVNPPAARAPPRLFSL
jgi:hypothetical protein